MPAGVFFNAHGDSLTSIPNDKHIFVRLSSIVKLKIAPLKGVGECDQCEV